MTSGSILGSPYAAFSLLLNFTPIAIPFYKLTKLKYTWIDYMYTWKFSFSFRLQNLVTRFARLNASGKDICSKRDAIGLNQKLLYICVCVCISEWASICICVHIYVYMNTCVYIRRHVCANNFAYISVYAYMRMYIWMYIWILVCMDNCTVYVRT